MYQNVPNQTSKQIQKTTCELFDDDRSLPLDKQMETHVKLLFFFKYNS